MNLYPLVSIIIPVYNEDQHIIACLDSLSKQTYPATELILVDDGSTDETIKKISSWHKQSTIDTQLLKQKHQGPGAARNLGVSKSKGDIVVFFDADMEADTAFISKLIGPIVKKQSKGTFSKDERVDNMDNPWAASWSLIRGFADGKMHPDDYPDKQPVFRAILKSEFEKAGGFDSNRGYDDDWSLSEKLGYVATHAPGAVFYHKNPGSISEIFVQARWLAKRKYKWGIIGKIIGLVRANIIGSVVWYVTHTSSFFNWQLLFSRITYDSGVLFGILEMILRNKTAK